MYRYSEPDDNFSLESIYFYLFKLPSEMIILLLFIQIMTYIHLRVHLLK